MSENMNQQKAKQKAKERDGWECRFCGVTNEQHSQEYGRGLEAHHLIKENDGGVDHPENLITVCRDCHTTLEKTQADALSRIKNKHTNEHRVKELESKVKELRETVNVLQSEKIETPIEVFTWLEQSSIRFHFVYRGILKPDVEIYQEKEKAAEAYSNNDDAVRIDSRTINISDLVEKSLRFISDEKIKPYVKGKGGVYFESGQEGQDYLCHDIPEGCNDKST